MKHYKLAAPVLFGMMAVTGGAFAQEAAPPRASLVDRIHPAFGLRVGGYGFRAADGSYTDCQMGGVGVLAQADLSRHFFVEGAVDSYTLSHAEAEAGMDRVSAITSVAGGVRFFPDFYVVPRLVAGAGLEWTRVEQAGSRLEGVYPVAFFGAGLELNVLAHLKGGAELRALGMAKPALEGGGAGGLRMQAEPASQGLFYVKYVL